MSQCPDDNDLTMFMAGLGSAEQRHGLEQHLDSCAICSEVLANAARSAPPAAAEQVTRIARYQLLAPLGQGGMGVVYDAIDPTLDRRVAVKLLRAEVPREAGARLVGEAKALARLSHPHVVQVLDAGEHDGQYYVAMERLVGATLDRWLTDTPHTAAEVIATLTQVAEGLAAIHAAGLTHRDVKPQNVLVNSEGKATIIDFGLALSGPSYPRGDGKREVAGTYAYMAPEQLRGEPVGPRSDQFAFCVALHEALYGHRPVVAGTVRSIALELQNAGKTIPPVIDALPPWVAHVIERGLSLDPRDRWRSMDELLGQLRIDEASDKDAQRKLNALFQVLLWPVHLALNALMIKVLTLQPQVGPEPVVDPIVDTLAAIGATWFIGAFLTGWAPLGLIWTPINAIGLLRRGDWAYRSTVVYSLFALPSIVGTPFAVYALLTMWRRAFPKKPKHKRSPASPV